MHTTPQGMFFATSLAVPLLAILWLYMNMLLRLWRGSAATHGPGPSRDKNNKSKGRENRKKATRTVVIIIVAFAICWTPLQVHLCPNLSLIDSQTSHVSSQVVLLLRKLDMVELTSALIVLQIASHCFAYFNSCLNPILYAFFSPNFRAAFFSKCFFLKSATASTKNGRAAPPAAEAERATLAAVAANGGGPSQAMNTFRWELISGSVDYSRCPHSSLVLISQGSS